MDYQQRLQLQQMINEHGVVDQTAQIRELKHSMKIHVDAQKLLDIRKYHYADEDYHDRCARECQFLYNNYTDIFNKIKNNEIDLQLFTKFLRVLKKVEDGVVDQHEASFEVGKILKEIYVDSALRRADKLDELAEEEKKSLRKCPGLNGILVLLYKRQRL